MRGMQKSIRQRFLILILALGVCFLSLSPFVSAATYGALDTTFGNSGMLTVSSMNSVSTSTIQPDGKILLAGQISLDTTQYNIGFGTNLVRLNSDGSTDTSFGQNGVATDHHCHFESTYGCLINPALIIVQNNGNILMVGGGFTNSSPLIFGLEIERFLPNGSLDTTFGTDGVVYSNLGLSSLQILSATTDSQGRIVMAGVGASTSRSSSISRIIRFNQDGTPDTSLNGSGMITYDSTANSFFDSLAAEADGSIVAGGWVYDATQADPSHRTGLLAKFTSSGVLDSSFGSNGIVLSNFSGNRVGFISLVLDNHGGIIVSDYPIDTQQGTSQQIRKFSVNGTLDTSFASDGIFTFPSSTPFVGSSLVLDSSGYIILSGELTSNNIGSNAFAVARLTPSGNIDQSFGVNGIATAQTGVYVGAGKVTLDNSDNIIAAGDITLQVDPNLGTDPTNYQWFGAIDRFTGGSTDSTSPVVSNIAFSTNPKSVNQASDTVTAKVSDDASGVSTVEYYDPVQAAWLPMSVSGSTASANISTNPLNYPAGMYAFKVRATDVAGNVSTPATVNLDVYNPNGGYAAAHGTITPNGSTSNPGDTLPTESGQNIKFNLDFTVKYQDSNSTTPTGSSVFTWGSNCNSPHSDCFGMNTDSLDWLIVSGNNAAFQGLATLSQGSQSLGSNYPIRLTVFSGAQTNSPSHYLLQIYAVGDNPDTATPLYQASGDLTSGQVQIHQ